MNVGLQGVGYLMVAVALVMGFTMVWFLNMLSDVSSASCDCGESCDMVHFKVPPMFYVGLGGAGFILLTGVYLAFKPVPFRAESSEQWSEKLAALDGDEETVYKLITDAGGALFQSEIGEKTGLSKVKVTRTLDKLESMRFLERRRRGLTNMVVLK